MSDLRKGVENLKAHFHETKLVLVVMFKSISAHADHTT